MAEYRLLMKKSRKSDLLDLVGANGIRRPSIITDFPGKVDYELQIID